MNTRSRRFLMLFASVIVLLIAVVIVAGVRLPLTADANRGWTSDQWLAEQRASECH